MKRFTKFVAICALIIGCGYAACSWIMPTYYIRYRLTMDVDVDGVVHRGTGVVEISYLLFPDAPRFSGALFHGFMHGCAITVDLGDRGLLFVVDKPPILKPMDDRKPPLFPRLISMGSLPLVAYGLPSYGTSAYMQTVLERLKLKSGPVDVTLESLPMLVRFRNIQDRGPVYEVNPTDLPTSFGKGTRITRVTLELTSDEVTSTPASWPAWLVTADQMQLELRADDPRLRVSDPEIWTYDFKSP